MTFDTFSLFAEPGEVTSSANALFFAILIIFFPETSISAILRSYSDSPICCTSFSSFLFGKSILSNFAINFEANVNTLFTFFQLQNWVSNVSRKSFFYFNPVNKDFLLVSGSFMSMSSTVWSFFHDDHGSKRNFGPLMYSKSSKLDFHAAYCFVVLSRIFSSKSKLWWHKLWVILFPSKQKWCCKFKHVIYWTQWWQYSSSGQRFFYDVYLKSSLSSSIFQGTHNECSFTIWNCF